MSMPGFVYHFSCPRCGRRSDEYPAFVFPNLGLTSMTLPTWSRAFSFFGSVTCDLVAGDYDRLRDDPQAQVAMAARLTSPVMTVGVPALRVEQDGHLIAVDVTPHPECPGCGSAVEVRFGYPPRDGEHETREPARGERLP